MKTEGAYLGSGEIPIPTDYNSKHHRSTANPVAVVVEYQRLIENVMQILVGLQDEASCKKTAYYKEGGGKGVFGNILAMHGVHETQQRGALHFHVVLWGGLTPKLLESADQCSSLCGVIGNVLDTMYRANLPRGLHVKEIIKKTMRSRRKVSLEKKPVGPAVVPHSVIDDGVVRIGRLWQMQMPWVQTYMFILSLVTILLPVVTDVVWEGPLA
jgi:hypothetical protein